MMNGYSGIEQDRLMGDELTDTQDKSVTAISKALPDASEQHLQMLVERIVEQDQLAFAALYRHLLERVYGLALRITRHAQLAEEVTEDAFWQVWRQAPRFDGQRGGVIVWVMTIARSRALDALRRQEAVEYENDTEATNLAGDNPQDLLLAVEEGSRIHDALAQLDPLPRQLVALSFFRGLSHDEIARYMDLPLGTVKSHIRRALLSLKQTLAVTADY